MISRKAKIYKLLLQAIDHAGMEPQDKERRKKRIKSLLRIKAFNEISKGVIFETESSIFVVGAHLPYLTYQGKRIIGMTTDSPMYRLFKGKKSGDTIDYGAEQESISIL
ncbi:hypothetical protein KMW28_13025 [Flammeovirga yaeyamensis]|uniref:Uncharacterized protein n=1 Tax=Flammeovirga yaeyamensis TaxID=367791 RepID=A0AAX1N349_9BACT|nr:hypothetical protein [Flammeovirga yaeyamensis]MBB3695906.1 hypothetical protein [Flammeovirga yaeyamensis]NMF34595.1 hypothetical protein [Flammeovirga yaeyamensis]QWG00575.1 hypothetical protein KMW28_13025 [Flammeovirga yaeyamensis]